MELTKPILMDYRVGLKEIFLLFLGKLSLEWSKFLDKTTSLKFLKNSNKKLLKQSLKWNSSSINMALIFLAHSVRYTTQS